MLTVDGLKVAAAEIDALVWKEYQDPSGATEPMCDGIVNPKEYVDAMPHLLWVLKEPWDDDGGGKSLIAPLNRDDVYEHVRKNKTLTGMVYPSYAILNGFLAFDDMDDLDKKPEMARIYRRIGYINVQKLPGPRQSDNSQVLEAYQKHKEIILKQIRSCEPQIVIGCHHYMREIMRDCGINIENIKPTNSSVQYAIGAGRLFIQTYHPSRQPIPHKEWVDDIVRVVKEVFGAGLLAFQGG